MTQAITGMTLENPKALEVVTQAAKNVLNQTCGVGAEAAPDDGDHPGEALILGIISLIGEVEWSLFLGLPRATAMAMAAKFTGFEIPFDSADMGDAVGELTNIFAGQVKQLLDDAGVKANISLPSVLRADNLQVLIRRQTSAKRACYQSEMGRFWTGVLAGTTQGLPV